MKSNKPLLRTYCLRCRKHTYNLLPQNKVKNDKDEKWQINVIIKMCCMWQ